MLFYEYWNKLTAKKPITGNVKMAPEQFKRMLNQAYDVGRKHGKDEGMKAGIEISKLGRPDTPGADFLSNLFNR